MKCRGRRFSRDLAGLLYTTVYNGKEGSGKVELVMEYGSVAPQIFAFLGSAPHFCLKPSEGERDERCARPPPRRPRRARVLARFSEKFRIFALFLEKVEKPPPLRIEPNFAPIFPRDVTNRPGP